MHVGMYVCVVCVHEHAARHRHGVASSSVGSTPYSLRQDLSLNRKLADLDRLAGQ